VTEGPVRVERGDGRMTVTLNRPDKLNSFTVEMHEAFRAALEEAARDGCRAVLVTGAGRAFCAGQDLSEPFPEGPDGRLDLGETLDRNFNPTVRLIRALEMPVIAAVNGVAAGAGANIALACDIVLAAKSARFIQAFVKIGLLPDSGGTWTLTRALGEARAKGLAMTGEPLSAERAEQWGLIWRCVEDAELMAEADALADSLAKGPTAGLALTKQAIHAAAANDFSSQLDLERDLQREAGRTHDHAEGVRAFSERRAPVFTGRREPE